MALLNILNQKPKDLLKQAGSWLSGQGSNATNAAQSVMGKNMTSVDPVTKSVASKVVGANLPALASLGKQAKSPSDNIQPPSTTISSNFSKSDGSNTLKKAPNYLTPNASSTTQTTQAVQSKPVTPTLTPSASSNQSALANMGGTPNSQGSTPVQPAQPVVPQQAPPGMQYDGNRNLVPSQTPPAQTDYSSGYNPTYGGIIGGLLNTAQNNPAYNEAQAAYERSVNKLGDFKRQVSEKIGNEESQGIPLEFVQGRQQVMRRQAAEQENALQASVNQQQQAIGLANTQQGLQQSGLQAAAGFTQPVSQFGMLTNPMTGQPLNTGVMNNALTNAYNMVKDGKTTWNDAIAASGLSQFGVVGSNALLNMINSGGGTFSPSAQNAAVGQNINYGQMTLQQAQALNTPMATLDALQPKILGVLAQGQINPTNIPAWNSQIGTYLSQANPEAMSQWGAISNEITSLGKQILAARNPGTPTSNDEMQAAADPSKLSGAQLKTVLDTWSALGNTAKGVLQGITQQTLGGYGYSGAAGGSPNIPQAGNTAGFQQPLAQGGAGALMNVINSPAALAAFVKSLFF